MFTTIKMTQVTPRRYDLDWLRVLAFGLLIVYHTGMLYVERWGFHFKSQYLSSSLEYLMLLSSPWRMLLIWFISGFALGAVLPHAAGWRHYLFFGLRRSMLLLLPLLTGIWLIVPPQLYAEMVQNDGLAINYWQFYQAFLDLQHPLFADYQSGIWPHVDVNHLWYLRALWWFTLLVLLLIPVLHSRIIQRGAKWLLGLALPWQLLLWATLMLLIRSQAEGDDMRELQGLSFLLLGFIAARQPAFWPQITHARHWLGMFCLLNYLLLCGLYYLSNYLRWQPDVLSASWQQTAYVALAVSYSFQAVAMVFWLLALAQCYLSRPHRYLPLANRLVFPVYLLHQSLIIIAALWLTPYALGGGAEAFLVLIFTLLQAALIVLLCWQLPVLAPLIGLQTSYRFSERWQKAGMWLGMLLISPLVITLLL